MYSPIPDLLYDTQQAICKKIYLPGARAGVEQDFEKLLGPEPGLKLDRLRSLLFLHIFLYVTSGLEVG